MKYIMVSNGYFYRKSPFSGFFLLLKKYLYVRIWIKVNKLVVTMVASLMPGLGNVANSSWNNKASMLQ